jgi:hypothetical protein
LRVTFRCLLIIPVFLLAAVSANSAEVYTWVDEHGKKHYSDQPPDDQTQQQTEVETRAFELENIDEGYPAGIVADPHRKERKAKEESVQKAARTKLSEQCERARADLTMLSGRISFNDGAGNEVRVTEAERKQMQKNLDAVISKHCR